MGKIGSSLRDQANASTTGYYAVGGNISVSGVTGDNSFNCAASPPCAAGTNFAVVSFNGTNTLTWNQAGPDSGPWTSQGSVGYYGCDYVNQSLPGLMTGCFSPFTFTKNVIYNTTQPTQTWPGTVNVDFFNSATSAIGFTNYTGDNTGNYQLLNTSSYHNAGNDGKDIGVSSITNLMQMTSGVDTLP